jgi:FMN phosphatase YigB (HAD superfamily)
MAITVLLFDLDDTLVVDEAAVGRCLLQQASAGGDR